MKDKHIRIRIEQCVALSQASNCPRRKFGALLIDPKRNVVLMDGYNGGPRGGGELCGGDSCWRDSLQIKSGTQVEVGCHHAEMNVICNAAAAGVRCTDAWLIVTGEPCLMCAKLIHHAGIAKVLVVDGGYAGANGIQYLRDHNVLVEQIANTALRDPRLTTEAPDPRWTQALFAGHLWNGAPTHLQREPLSGTVCDTCGKPSTRPFLVVLASKRDSNRVVPFVCSIECAATLDNSWINDPVRSDRAEVHVGLGRRMLADQLECHWGIHNQGAPTTKDSQTGDPKNVNGVSQTTARYHNQLPGCDVCGRVDSLQRLKGNTP
jgi:dCMP deaminase